MKLTVKTFSEELQSRMDHYHKIYGVLIFAILKYEEDYVQDIYKLSQSAAIEGLKTIRKLDEDYYNTHGFTEEEKKSYLLNILNESPKGELLTTEEFFGPWFDFKNKKLFLRGRTKNFLNEYFFAGEEEKEENVKFKNYTFFSSSLYQQLKKRNVYKYDSYGYAKCFIEPPYRLSATNIEINQLFLDFNKLLFYDFKYLMTIYLWDDNCSDFFKWGREWWGAYLWTVLIEEKKELIIIAASSTD